MNVYANAIEILEWINSNTATKLVFRIAMNNPSAVVRAYEDIHGPSVDNKIREFAKEGNSKIQCIKFCRKLTGEGLNEAKEHVERVASF